MELRQIQTFVTITQTESFSKAAEFLGYSQSAVTVQIRLLEEELGDKLFERMNRKVYLTASGRRFLSHAERIIHDMERARDSVKEEEELHSPLHIGTLESLCFSRLPRILDCFRQEHPKVPIKITTAAPNELIYMMEKNQLDLIYILDRQRHSDNWNKAMEKSEPIVFTASALYGWGRERSVKLDDILSEPFFLTEKNENYRRELDHFLETRNRSLTPFLEFSNTEFIIRMLERNRGISYLPLFAVRESAEAGKLSILNTEELKLTMYSQLIYHKSKWITKEMEAFIQQICKGEEYGNSVKPQQCDSVIQAVEK